MSMRLRSAFAALLVVLVTSHTSSAAIQTFFDQAAFNTAVASNGLTAAPIVNFDGETTGAKGLNYSLGGIGFGLATGTTELAVNSLAPSLLTNALGMDDALFPEFGNTDTLTLTLPAGTQALALNVLISTDFPQDIVNFATLTYGGVSLSTGDGTAVATPAGAGINSYFFGILATTLGEASATATLSATGSSFYYLDNVQIASIAAVPEPNSWALAIGAGTVFFGRRRRRD